MKKNNDRIEIIDLIRGIAIILMIAGHIGFGNIIKTYVYSFHVAIFYLISGYFYRNKQIKKDLIKLIIPYFVYGLINAILFYIIFKYDFIHNIKSLFWNNTEIKGFTALWFLTSLFFSKTIFSIYNKINKKVKIVFIVLFTAISYFLMPFQLPYSLKTTFVGFILIYCGNLLNKYNSSKYVYRIMNLSLIETILLALFTSISIWLNGFVNMRSANYGNLVLFLFNAISMSTIIFNILRYIEKAINDKFLNKTLNIVKNIGKNSLLYLCFNQILIAIFMKILDFLNVNIIIKKIIVLVCAILTIYLYTNIKEKIKNRRLV